MRVRLHTCRQCEGLPYPCHVYEEKGICRQAWVSNDNVHHQCTLPESHGGDRCQCSCGQRRAS
jgi:hypothetical protein